MSGFLISLPYHIKWHIIYIVILFIVHYYCHCCFCPCYVMFHYYHSQLELCLLAHYECSLCCGLFVFQIVLGCLLQCLSLQCLFDWSHRHCLARINVVFTCLLIPFDKVSCLCYTYCVRSGVMVMVSFSYHRAMGPQPPSSHRTTTIPYWNSSIIFWKYHGSYHFFICLLLTVHNDHHYLLSKSVACYLLAWYLLLDDRIITL